MAIVFLIEKDDLIHAMKPFFQRGGKRKAAEFDYVEVKAEGKEVEFNSSDFVSIAKANVTASGCARFAFPFFETLFRKPQDLAWSPTGRISIRITHGQIQAGATTFTSPDLSLVGRVLELPAGATLHEMLALTLQYSEQELKEGGVWDRVQAAQTEAAQLIEKAAKLLWPLNITRDCLRSFVWEQIAKPAERLKL